MDEDKAEMLAKVLGGETWQSGGDIWLVILKRADGKIVAISDELVAEYADETELALGGPSAQILLV